MNQLEQAFALIRDVSAKLLLPPNGEGFYYFPAMTLVSVSFLFALISWKTRNRQYGGALFPNASGRRILVYWCISFMFFIFCLFAYDASYSALTRSFIEDVMDSKAPQMQASATESHEESCDATAAPLPKIIDLYAPFSWNAFTDKGVFYTESNLASETPALQSFDSCAEADADYIWDMPRLCSAKRYLNSLKEGEPQWSSPIRYAISRHFVLVTYILSWISVIWLVLFPVLQNFNLKFETVTNTGKMMANDADSDSGSDSDSGHSN